MEHYKNLSLEDIVYFCEIDLIEKTEQWKDIVGYEGMYQVSNFGRVKSLERTIMRIDNIPLSIRLKINCTNFNKKTKYITISLWKNNKEKRCTIHRLVAIAFIHNSENKPEVNHINGIKTDNRVENLEWVTQSENKIHAYKTGLQKTKKGEDSVVSKLTEKEVLLIRRLFKINPFFSRIKASKKFNVDSRTICYVIYRKSWKHI